MKQDFLKVLQALNLWAQGGGDLTQSSTAKADLPQGAGMDPLSLSDTASLSNPSWACLDSSSQLTPSLSASSRKPRQGGGKVGMAQKKHTFLGQAGSPMCQTGENRASQSAQKFAAGLRFTHSPFSISIWSPKWKGIFCKHNQTSLHLPFRGGRIRCNLMPRCKRESQTIQFLFRDKKKNP